MIDRKAFFDSVRAAMFGGTLKQTQVDGMTAILDTWERGPNADLRHLAYMLATTKWETDSTMQPIEEYGHGAGRPYGVPDTETGQIYYGRGLVQLTWKDNYRKLGGLLDVDLLNEPALALDPDVASEIMFLGMAKGLFTGVGLPRYFNDTTDNPLDARRIINGMDHAHDIAGLHSKFLTALGSPHV